MLGEDIFLVENDQKKSELRQYTNAEKTESHLLIDGVQLDKNGSIIVSSSNYHTIKDKIIFYTLELTDDQKLFEIDEKNNFVKVLGEDIFLVKNDQKTELRQYTNEEKTESRLLTEGVHLNEYSLTKVVPSIYLEINKSLNLNSITKENFSVTDKTLSATNLSTTEKTLSATNLSTTDKTLSAKIKNIFQPKPVLRQPPKLKQSPKKELLSR